MLPASDRLLHDPFSIEGRPWQPFGAARVPQFANHLAVSTDYFRVMGIALRAGRIFSTQDKDGSQPMAMVNETLVRASGQGKTPLVSA